MVYLSSEYFSSFLVKFFYKHVALPFNCFDNIQSFSKIVAFSEKILFQEYIYDSVKEISKINQSHCILAFVNSLLQDLKQIMRMKNNEISTLVVNCNKFFINIINMLLHNCGTIAKKFKMFLCNLRHELLYIYVIRNRILHFFSNIKNNRNRLLHIFKHILLFKCLLYSYFGINNIEGQYC